MSHTFICGPIWCMYVRTKVRLVSENKNSNTKLTNRLNWIDWMNFWWLFQFNFKSKKKIQHLDVFTTVIDSLQCNNIFFLILTHALSQWFYFEILLNIESWSAQASKKKNDEYHTFDCVLSVCVLCFCYFFFYIFIGLFLIQSLCVCVSRFMYAADTSFSFSPYI